MWATYPDSMRELAHDLSRLLGRIALREVLCAAAGLKPVRISVGDVDTSACVGVLTRLGLSVAVGSDVRWIANDRGKGGWSSTSGKPGEGEAWKHLYVACDDHQAHELRTAEERGDDEEFGRLLLVPACCREMFHRRRTEAESVQMDFFRYTYPAATSRCPWRTNLGAQYFDAAMLSHYPCAPGCRESLRLADIAWRICASTAPAMARAMAELMRSPCVYSEDHGIYLLSGATWDGTWLSGARTIHATCGSGELHSLLSRHSRIRCPAIGEIEGEDGGKCASVRAEGLRMVIPCEEQTA
jgi:hypothetical protein